MSHFLIIGPPGCGKGTASKEISKKFKIKHISTGDLLRNTKDEEIQNLLKTGSFVSDECITRLVKDELETSTCILDGYPRTLKQAKILGDEVGLCLFINTSDEECIKRIQGRNDQREDDTNTSIIKKRLEIYHSITEPVIDFYKEKGIVHSINGNLGIEEVYQQIEEIILNLK